MVSHPPEVGWSETQDPNVQSKVTVGSEDFTHPTNYARELPLMIRSAAPEDTKIIGQLIRALANYEKLSHVVQLDENRLREHLFGPRPYAEVLLAEEDEWRKPLPPLQSGYDLRTPVVGF